MEHLTFASTTLLAPSSAVLPLHSPNIILQACTLVSEKEEEKNDPKRGQTLTYTTLPDRTEVFPFFLLFQQVMFYKPQVYIYFI